MACRLVFRHTPPVIVASTPVSPSARKLVSSDSGAGQRLILGWPSSDRSPPVRGAQTIWRPLLVFEGVYNSQAASPAAFLRALAAEARC